MSLLIGVLRERDRLLLRKKNPPWWSCRAFRREIWFASYKTWRHASAHGFVSREPSSSFFQEHSSLDRATAQWKQWKARDSREKVDEDIRRSSSKGTLRLVCFPYLRFERRRVDNKRSAEMRHGSLLRFYDESFREMRIEFRQWNWGRRRLVPKSQSRLLGFEREKSMDGIIPIVIFDLIDWLDNQLIQFLAE